MANGTGPGVITPDGCAVELYRLLPPMGEPEIVHAAIPAGAAVLELGAGAGRVTHPLVTLGHLVVAVDESAAMLACVRGAETVQAKIQHLRLDRRFDVVLLASFLVNVPDPALRRRFLETCRAHVGEEGCVLVQRHPAAWFDEAVEGERTSGGVTFRLRDLRRPAPGLLAATAEYQAGERVWTQTFTAGRLDDQALEAALAEAGLATDAYLTGDGSWVRAVPASRGRALGRSPR
ncbi:MAG TPA: class I SAM-dependent methyltransferase [Actinomycetes bacterium]|nr:class I SAM-dependent methyltransferase [Actinomycetes bacterium]